MAVKHMKGWLVELFIIAFNFFYNVITLHVTGQIISILYLYD